jgi:hypothetical protein
MMRWRAATLEKGIASLLRDEGFKNKLYQTPLLQGLWSPNARGQQVHKPSYIPSSTFALAVLHLAETEGIDLTGAALGSPPSSAIGSPPSDETTALLQSLLRGADSLQEQRKRLEDWFDTSMDRISGWYKRKSNAWLWIIGSALCLLVNGDSISLSKLLWNDQALRTATVAAAESVKNPSPGSTTAPDPQTAFANLKEVRNKLANVNLPLGWCWGSKTKKCFPSFNNSDTPDAYDSDPRMIWSGGSLGETFLWWWWKVVGVALTALAISQGAPFWFGLLQKAVNLRLAGNAPDEKQSKK